MKYFITIRVVDRSPKENYIYTTMKSLITSGLFNSKIPFELHLFDGKPNSSEYLNKYESLENLFVHRTEKEITRNENWLRSIEYCKDKDCEYVIQLEDDILFCKHWLESIDAYIAKNQKFVNKVPMVTFYSAYQEVRRKTEAKREYWNQSFQQFYGTQCILFKKDIALKAVKHIIDGIENIDKYMFKFREKGHKPVGMKGACIDLWLQEWGVHEYPNKYFLVSCPSFVQHIGETEGKHLHQSHFLGENWSYKKGI